MLFDRKAGKIKARYTTENGLCNNSVLTLLDDEKGNLWMSTYNGISKFNIAQKEFTNFYQSDGLQSNQFQINSSLKLKSGEMVFGGIKGFNIFRPASIIPVNNSPNLLLTGLDIDNLPVEQYPSFIKGNKDGQIVELKVPYDKAVFSFEFTALEYSAANKVSYAYYMDGWDRDWNKEGNSRTATYTHMNEGSYVFRVKNTNVEGIWNSKQISLKIIVLPPWYRTWWAYLIYFSVVAALVYLYFLYQARQTKLTYEVKIANLSAQQKRLNMKKNALNMKKNVLLMKRKKN
ncbi:triple tyrosine motif-containing protein [Pedobacter steynii]